MGKSRDDARLEMYAMVDRLRNNWNNAAWDEYLVRYRAARKAEKERRQQVVKTEGQDGHERANDE